jgi:O-antigen/teichoic acid export membrane protein
MSRVRRSAWSYLTAVAFAGITLTVALVSTPLLLRWLGEERFGACRAATDWNGYLNLLELGLAGALLPLLARALQHSEAEAVGVTLAAGVRAYVQVTIGMLLGGVVLAAGIPWLVPVGASLSDDLRGGFCLGLLGLFLVPLVPFRLLAEADQRGYVVNALIIVQSLVITGLALLLAWWDWGITGQFAAVLGGAVVFNVLVLAYTWKYNAGVLRQVAASSQDHALSRELWHLNWPTLIHNICGRISLLTDNIVIAALLGPAAVVPFYLTQRLALLVQGQLQGIGTASWAALAELYLKGEHGAFSARVLELTGLVSILGVSCLVPIVAYNQYFVTIWVGAGQFGGEALTILAGVNGYLLALFSLWGWVFSGTGKIARLVPLLIISTSVNLPVSLAATWLIGLPGPAIGTCVAFVGINLICFPLLLYHVYGIAPAALLKAAGFPLLLGAPFGVGVWLAARSHDPWGWVGLGAEMALAAGVYVLGAWLILFTRQERADWRQRIRLVLPWGRGT